jgi:hypothetical protein
VALGGRIRAAKSQIYARTSGIVLPSQRQHGPKPKVSTSESATSTTLHAQFGAISTSTSGSGSQNQQQYVQKRESNFLTAEMGNIPLQCLLGLRLSCDESMRIGFECAP